MSREEDFLNKMNSAENNDGMSSSLYIDELIFGENNEKVNGKEESGALIIQHNFDEIINKVNDRILADLAIDFLNIPELDKVLTKKFAEISRRTINITPKTFREFYQSFINKSFGHKEYIVKNIEKLTKELGYEFLFDATQLIKGQNQEFDKKLNDMLEKNLLEISKVLLRKKVYMNDFQNENKDLQDETIKEYAETLKIMIEELLKSEKKKPIDIDILGNGAYSNVYKIGEKVIKIGMPKEKYNIPNHRRILQPLIRTNFIKNGKNIFCIEVEDEVDTEFTESEKTDEMLYKIYKELREAGLIFTDISWENIGKLKKDNKPSLGSKEMYVSPNSVGFDKELTEEPLKKGSIVILDKDYIYKEDDDDITFFEKTMECENRYEEEKEKEVEKQKEDIDWEER